MRNTIVVLAVLALAIFHLGAEPATKPATSKPAPVHIGEMQLQTLPEMNYLSGLEQTTFADIAKTYEKLAPMFEKAFAEGKARVAGPMMSIYTEVDSEKMDKPFKLEIGYIVTPDTKDVGILKFRKTRPFKCATILFTGPITSIGEAYGKLIGQIHAKGLELSGEGREMCLYWEKLDSPNNVVQIQMGLK